MCCEQYLAASAEISATDCKNASLQKTIAKLEQHLEQLEAEVATVKIERDTHAAALKELYEVLRIHGFFKPDKA